MQQTEATRAEPVFVAPTQKFTYFMLKVSLLLFCVYINFIIKFCVSVCRTPTNEFLVDVNISILVFSVYLYNIYVYIYMSNLPIFLIIYPKNHTNKNGSNSAIASAGNVNLVLINLTNSGI